MNKSESVLSRPSSLLSVTSGCVLMLLIVQFVTGTTMAFYYVPSIDHAHTTVTFIEKVLSSGSWLRSLHHYGSQWLALFVFLHLLRLHSIAAYKTCRVHWVATVLLLALVMVAGGTGYSLPWDARAFFSTRVAENLLAGLPLVGRVARLWLLGGTDISTLTLSRFFALHVLVVPFAILIVVASKFLRATFEQNWWPAITRNAVAAGILFLLLSLWSLKFPAPLGPTVTNVTGDYLPRPGPQFLWLFETLKHWPGGLGSIAGIVLPGLLIVVLLLTPWSDRLISKRFMKQPAKLMSTCVLIVIAFWVTTMTMTAYLRDWRDQRVRQQLAKQAIDEKRFRSAPFVPGALYFEGANELRSDRQSTTPEAYSRFCANCHGANGEGATQGQLRFPPLLGVGKKPRRTVNDIVELLNDPSAFGLQPPMRSFATKLTEPEKKEIAAWVVKLE